MNDAKEEEAPDRRPTNDADRVLAKLTDSTPRSAPWVAAMTGLTVAQARATLVRLAAEQRIVTVSDPTKGYRLPQPGESAIEPSEPAITLSRSSVAPRGANATPERAMTLTGGARIAAGIAVFLVCWVVQATMGDTTMFSMTYLDKGFVPSMLINVTFWPGWMATVALIGSGTLEVLDGG